MKVYLLNHFRNDEDLDGYKIIGIFSTEKEADSAIKVLKEKSGFKEYPDNFNIGIYEVDKMFWVDGFG